MTAQNRAGNQGRSQAEEERRQRGKRANLAGHAAEAQVARLYGERGAVLLEKCWRGQSGEIDLIFALRDEILFVEVKKSKDFARAAESLRPAQMQRICLAAEEYVGALPDGLLTPMRIDVALVDTMGRIEILENAIGH